MLREQRHFRRAIAVGVEAVGDLVEPPARALDEQHRIADAQRRAVRGADGGLAAYRHIGRRQRLVEVRGLHRELAADRAERQNLARRQPSDRVHLVVGDGEGHRRVVEHLARIVGRREGFVGAARGEPASLRLKPRIGEAEPLLVEGDRRRIAAHRRPGAFAPSGGRDRGRQRADHVGRHLGGAAIAGDLRPAMAVMEIGPGNAAVALRAAAMERRPLAGISGACRDEDAVRMGDLAAAGGIADPLAPGVVIEMARLLGDAPERSDMARLKEIGGRGEGDAVSGGGARRDRRRRQVLVEIGTVDERNLGERPAHMAGPAELLRRMIGMHQEQHIRRLRQFQRGQIRGAIRCRDLDRRAGWIFDPSLVHIEPEIEVARLDDIGLLGRELERDQPDLAAGLRFGDEAGAGTSHRRSLRCRDHVLEPAAGTRIFREIGSAMQQRRPFAGIEAGQQRSGSGHGDSSSSGTRASGVGGAAASAG